MAKLFTIEDETTGGTTKTDGVVASPGMAPTEVLTGTDSYDVKVAAGSPGNITTGAGNDTINLAKTSSNMYVDAGSGMNFITGSAHANDQFCATASAAPTVDTITNFHLGDCLTLNAPDAAGFTLNWTDTPGVGSTLTATTPGEAPITMVLRGFHDSGAMLAQPMNLGHQVNLTLNA